MLSFDLDKAKAALPVSLLCRHDDLPVERPPRLLSAMAFSPTLESSFSGITYHLARAGLSTQQLEGCFSLYSGEKPSKSLQIRGALWKFGRVLRRQTTSGFKFSAVYLEEVWPRYMDALAGATLISNFQLYSREFVRRRKSLDIGMNFYIDGTLSEYFETYANYEVDAIDATTMRQAVELEQEGYHSADRIVTMSKLTALCLQQRYSISAQKISVIVPGANLLDDEVDSTEISSSASLTDEFVLGFVGLYPMRKGLDRLAEAVKILRARGLPIRLRVIGSCPEELTNMDGLDYLGRIDKATEPGKFIQAIGSVHLGCLVSRSELAGIAMVEFLRVGVPILGTRVGGATDILEGGGSLSVAPDIEGEELAEVIGSLYHDTPRYLRLKKEAKSRQEWASWKRVADELDTVLA